MALFRVKLYSVEEFEAFIAQPEHRDQRWEFIHGEVIEVPSNPYSSQIAAFIIAALVMFVRPRGLGHVTGEGAGYMIDGQRFSPDGAFVSKRRQAALPYHEQYNPIAPDLMLEVLSPSNKATKDERAVIENKIRVCAAENILLWIVDPDLRSVYVYTPGQKVETLDIDGTLVGGSVLPGFSLPVRDIFPE